MRKSQSSLCVVLLIAGLSFAVICRAQTGMSGDGGGGNCRPASPDDGATTTAVVANWKVRVWTWVAHRLPAETSGRGMGLVAYRRSNPATTFRGKR